MMRYKTHRYSCQCCETTGRGHGRAQDKLEAQADIAAELEIKYINEREDIDHRLPELGKPTGDF
jgi:hypothetical protein